MKAKFEEEAAAAEYMFHCLLILFLFFSCTYTWMYILSLMK